jgi:hypothetical protein
MRLARRLIIRVRRDEIEIAIATATATEIATGTAIEIETGIEIGIKARVSVPATNTFSKRIMIAAPALLSPLRWNTPTSR